MSLATQSAPMPPPDRISFTDADFAVIAQLAARDFGLHLTAAKRDLVYSRLLKRLRLLRLDRFGDYCALIQGPKGAEERVAMLSALTTNVTHFFREAHHFRLMHETALPPLIAAARNGARVRLWSAGCSAGQEPYSLAFTVLALCPEAAQLNLRILATDVDTEILGRAEQGLYGEEELKAIPEPLRQFTEPTSEGRFAVGDKARRLITFARLNLIESWPMAGPFDVIFCRNVSIYFDKPIQSRLWTRFAEMLAPGGYLCIGHSERVSGPAEARFRPIGVTAYRRLGPEATAGAKPTIRHQGAER